MSIDKIEAGDELSHSGDQFRRNIEKLKQLFPQVVAENKVDLEVLRQILGDELESDEEFYRFTWAGKSQARLEAHKSSTGTLRPAKEESVNWDDTKNLYLEGDNLEVLKLLQKGYAGKVKMIYIDPPYNTGNDFVYSDNYSDNLRNYLEITGVVDSRGRKLTTNSSSEGRFHSNWLNMMFPRLILSRVLLSDEGIIAISIDDNEVTNLRKICDEVFGEMNFVTTFCWEKKKKPSFLNKNLGTKFEYILVYAKDRTLTGPFSVELTTEGKKYPFNNAGNSENTLTFPKNSVRFGLPDQIIEPQDMSEGKIITKLLDEVSIVNGLNENEFRLRGEWRYSQSKLDEIVANKEEIVVSKVPFRPNHIKAGGEVKKMHNLLTVKHYSVQTNEDADAEQTRLLGQSFFEYTKPSGLIKLLIKAYMFDDKEGLVLDFFSGSGTTAHSVLLQNLEDGGARRFIMIQLPELIDAKSKAFEKGYRTVAQIGKERIKQTFKELESNGSQSTKHLDLGFKVFKLAESSIVPWSGNAESFEDELFSAEFSIRNDRSSFDIVTEVLLKYGIDITSPIEVREVSGHQLYSVGYGALFVCMDSDIRTSIGEELGKWKEELNPSSCRVVLRDSGLTDVRKTNIYQILKRFGVSEVRSI